MSAEENEAQIRHAIELLNQGDLDGFLGHFAPSCIIHGIPAGFEPNVEGYKEFLVSNRIAFPDIKLSIEDLIATEDRTATRIAYRATHLGHYRHLTPPTHKKVMWIGIFLSHFAGGKIIEQWQIVDRLGLMHEIGAISSVPMPKDPSYP